MRLSQSTYPDDDCDRGPVCSKCHREIVTDNSEPAYFNGAGKWLCDSCAAACEDDADARREQRRYDP